jgi:tetratricopeptide (TPR) repeat protein
MWSMPERELRPMVGTRFGFVRLNMDARSYVSGGLICGAVSILMLGSLATSSIAQDSVLSNVDLCNGRDRSSPEPQIRGCSALIKSDADNAKILAIAYNNRGNAYTTQGQYDLAIEDYDKSINLDPHYAKPLNNRGVVHKRKGDLDLAMKDFDAALGIDPFYAEAFINRAQLREKQDDLAGALKDFDEAIRLQPDMKGVWNERCWARAINGDLQGALADCNEAIRTEPNVAVDLDSRGFVYLRSGQWDLAIADFNAALRLDPKLASALYGRGVAKQRKGDGAGATDIAAAQAINQNIAAEYTGYGVR